MAPVEFTGHTRFTGRGHIHHHRGHTTVHAQRGVRTNEGRLCKPLHFCVFGPDCLKKA